MANLSSSRVRHRRVSRTFFCSKEKNDSIAALSPHALKGWVKSLRKSLSDVTVASIVALLSMIFGDAVEEELISSNPCRRLRIGDGEDPERPHATPEQVIEAAVRLRHRFGVLVVMAAYTGMRWGELAGLRWPRVDLEAGQVKIDPKEGALHEVNGRLTLGPPKTPASARPVDLPPFLVGLLKQHRTRVGGDGFVFTGVDGGLLRRSNFRRRVWFPAFEGDRARGWHPATLGLHSHVTRPTVDHLLAAMQARWEHSGSKIWADHYQDSLPRSKCGLDQLLPICSQKRKTTRQQDRLAGR